MGEMRRIRVEIDAETAFAVDLAVAAGEYRGADDLLREALRLWADARVEGTTELSRIWAERTRRDEWLNGNFTLDEIRGAAA